jgi:predicted AlkP superfamily phosphohydrolase/phosphomutase
MAKVFVLGLDGATPDVVNGMIAAGELPTFARLRERGASGVLQSTLPAISPPAWTTFATGKNPGKHGIVGFTRMICSQYRMRLVTGADNRAQTLWDLLGARDKRVIVVNVPMTYPPRPVNGLLVTGLDTPGLHVDFTHPRELKRELLGVVPDYTINLHLGGYLQSDRSRQRALGLILSSIDARHRAVKHLMEAHPWDFFVVRFNNPDVAQHHYWKYMDPSHPDFSPHAAADLRGAIAEVYRRLDAVAADLLERLDADTTLVVLSDHGAGPRINKAILLNQWLCERGYLARRDPAAGGRRAFGRPRDALAGPLRRFLAFAPPPLKIRLKRLFPAWFARLSLLVKFSAGLGTIDWARTAAFYAEEDGLRLHVKARYPAGVVEPADYEPLRARLIAELEDLRDPDGGEPLFERVWRREEVYRGPCAEELPDVLLLTRGSLYDISGQLLPIGREPGGFVRKQPNWNGANGRHRPEGVLFLHGPGVRGGAELTKAALPDLFPTILHAVGLPIPNDVDGRVLSEAFEEAFLERTPVRWEKAEGIEFGDADGREIYTDEEQMEVLSHLKGLGYIE